MLGSWCNLSRLMVRLRSPAIIWGAAPVLTWERSWSKVASRTQWTRFSLPQRPRHSSSSLAASAFSGGRLVTA